MKTTLAFFGFCIAALAGVTGFLYAVKQLSGLWERDAIEACLMCFAMFSAGLWLLDRIER